MKSTRWLPVARPLAEHRLAPELRPNRVGRLAEGLPAGVADPGFEPLLVRIDQEPFHSADRVDVFFEGVQAFAAMLESVANARAEVLLESYIFKDDPTGIRFKTALIAAAKRGVAVRVLADGFGSFQTRTGFWRELRDNGVEARLYHPLGFALRRMRFRDHRKILVADRRSAFTGGMNIGDEYGSAHLRKDAVYRDSHARVEGDVARGVAVVFQEGWRRAGGGAIEIEPWKETEKGGPRVLILDSRPGRGVRETASVLAATVGAARRRVWITMAYFAPRTRAIGILGDAAQRGVDVRLILPGRTDVRVVRHAGHGFYASLLRRGVRIFEYEPAILHAKTMVVDGLVSIVGSTNFDFRSLELNAECNFVIRDEATGARMERQFEADLGQSREILLPAWRRRFWLHRGADAFARRLAPFL